MDDIVRQAIAKWPHVPDCFGWLGLDARGRWWLRDDGVQAAGPFPASRGTVLAHAGLLAFIERNYECGPAGAWFFQNGPQRVHVELESTPLVWRLDDGGLPTSHCGQPGGPVRACLLDENGFLYLDAGPGLGRVHTLDMDRAADQIERGAWVPEPVQGADLPGRYGYLTSPKAHQDSLLK